MDTAPDQMRPQGIDVTILPALLARLDTGVARDLRQQFGADLVSLRAALDTALRPPLDVTATARQAHVLIALAGTAGAAALSARARALLDAAHAGDALSCANLATGILPEVERLAAFVRSCPLPSNRSGP